MLLHKRLNLQANQLIKAHLQNCRCLPLCKPEHGRHLLGNLGLKLDIVGHTAYQASLSVLHRLTSPENLYNQVNHVARLD